MAEEEVAAAVAAAASPVPSDNKRKLEDLESEAPEPVVTSASKAETQLDLDLNEVQNSEQEAEEILDGASQSPEAKRPRLDEETNASAAENGHKVQQSDEPLMEIAQQPTVENLQTENDQQPTLSDVQTENDQQPTVVDLQAENDQQTTVGNLQTDNTEQLPVEDLQIAKNEQSSMENQQTGNAQPSFVENYQTGNAQHPSGEDLQQSAGIPQQIDLSAAQHLDPQAVSRKMEVPNTKVGVLIGKSGDTIRFLQYNSGAKIQITRDMDADPYSSTRPLELIGTLENINKAEKLIKDVIAEADAGGSPSLVARGFGNAQAGGPTEQLQMPVPNEKVGLIIGKGGENIKNLQTRSGARIQVLIPQHLPEGDQSKERTVRVTGNRKQIEMAKEMITEVMNQPVRPSSFSGSYGQQTYRPRGPAGPPQWGPRAPSPVQPTGYDYQQRGMYPSQNQQYPPSTYGGYPQQPAPRSSFNAGWDQRTSAPVQAPPPQSGGYDYYGQGGGHIADGHASTPVSTTTLAPASAGHPPMQVNYNYGQPQGPDYGQPTTYSQSVPPQQSYGHGYDDPRYGNQPPVQQAYGGHGNSQPGAYPQQVSSQPGYSQQPYTRPPSHGMPSQGPPPQSYVSPRPNQPGEVPYQGPISSTHSYGPSAQSQQSYPYVSGGPSQQTYPYGSTPANDGYNQQPSGTASAPGYPQQGSQAVSGYAQPGGQPAPGYSQGGPTAGYGPYSSQPSYNEQPIPNNANYGYQGPTDPGYNNVPGSAYVAPSSGQVGYVQQTSNQPGYDQTMPQSGGYGGAPVTTPASYGKGLSPQPGYAQYDSTQMYAGHH